MCNFVKSKVEIELFLKKNYKVLLIQNGAKAVSGSLYGLI